MLSSVALPAVPQSWHPSWFSVFSRVNLKREASCCGSVMPENAKHSLAHLSMGFPTHVSWCAEFMITKADQRDKTVQRE